MRQARALPSPNETLYIEEIKFWLRAMQEHTKFIKAGLPAEAADFSEAAGNFAAAFDGLLQEAEHLKSVKQSKDFVGGILDVMRAFEDFQRKILADMFQGKIRGTNFPFFLDHILREAKCFEAFLVSMQEEKGAVKSVSHTREIVIWLRFMADHTRLLAHYIDPSECRMLRMVEEFAGLFDNLVLEARDLASMLYCHKGEVKVFRRFLLDIRIDVQRLRDFNRMAEELIRDCRLLGIMSAELAAHMKREAEHCLLKIALLEKEFLKHCPDEFQDDVDDTVWEAEAPERGEEEDGEGAAVPEGESEEAVCEPEIKEQAEEPTMDTGETAADFSVKEVPAAALEEAEVVKVREIAAGEQAEPLRGECETVALEAAAETFDTVIINDNEKQEEPAAKAKPSYIKPSEQKTAPRSFMPSMPRERYDKTRQLLPRPLGKAKK